MSISRKGFDSLITKIKNNYDETCVEFFIKNENLRLKDLNRIKLILDKYSIQCKNNQENTDYFLLLSKIDTIIQYDKSFYFLYHFTSTIDCNYLVELDNVKLALLCQLKIIEKSKHKEIIWLLQVIYISYDIPKNIMRFISVCTFNCSRKWKEHYQDKSEYVYFQFVYFIYSFWKNFYLIMDLEDINWSLLKMYYEMMLDNYFYLSDGSFDVGIIQIIIDAIYSNVNLFDYCTDDTFDSFFNLVKSITYKKVSIEDIKNLSVAIVQNEVEINPLFARFLAEQKSFIDELIFSGMDYKIQNCKEYIDYLDIIKNSNGLIKKIDICPENPFTLEVSTKKILYRYPANNNVAICISSNNFLFYNTNYVHINIYKDKFYYNTRNKTVPLSIKQIRTYPFIQKLIKRYLIFLSEIRHNKFIKEIAESDWNFWIIPININEIIQYHNWKDFFINTYRKSQNLKFKWNKHNPNYSYLVLKSLDYLDEKSKNILMQMKETDINYIISRKTKIKDYVIDFLTHIYLKRLNVENEDTDYDYNYTIIKDYISISIVSKKKISLTYKNINRINEEHIDRMNDNLMKTTPIIKIPKNSRFNELRNILPKDMEWITSKNRLIKESIKQNHCVWSYGYDINADICAIYSFIYSDGKRYTIEFKLDNDYYVSQIQGYNNRKNCTHALNYVESLLEVKQK
jgi:hypothetical protein